MILTLYASSVTSLIHLISPFSQHVALYWQNLWLYWVRSEVWNNSLLIHFLRQTFIFWLFTKNSAGDIKILILKPIWLYFNPPSSTTANYQKLTFSDPELAAFSISSLPFAFSNSRYSRPEKNKRKSRFFCLNFELGAAAMGRSSVENRQIRNRKASLFTQKIGLKFSNTFICFFLLPPFFANFWPTIHPFTLQPPPTGEGCILCSLFTRAVFTNATVKISLCPFLRSLRIVVCWRPFSIRWSERSFLDFLILLLPIFFFIFLLFFLLLYVYFLFIGPLLTFSVRSHSSKYPTRK